MGSEIIAFPLHRRRHLIIELASALRAKHGQEATQFWRDTAKKLLHQLSLTGVAIEDAQDQVRNLLYAVIAEMEADTMKASG